MSYCGLRQDSKYQYSSHFGFVMGLPITIYQQVFFTAAAVLGIKLSTSPTPHKSG
jgi:hypothetical protein